MTNRVFNVPDISCHHCKRLIEETLAAVPEVDSAVVTVDRREVQVAGTVSDDAVITAIEGHGAAQQRCVVGTGMVGPRTWSVERPPI